MPRTTKASSYELVDEEIPERRSIYRDMVEEFLASGKESVRIGGELAKSVKPMTLVTSLQQAKRGKPVMVKKINDSVYLKRKPLVTPAKD